MKTLISSLFRMVVQPYFMPYTILRMLKFLRFLVVEKGLDVNLVDKALVI